MEIKTERESRYEVLRVVSAIFILFNHINANFDKQSINMISDINRHAVMLFHMGGKFGVNIFVILGSYFLCYSEFKTSRIMRLLGETIFYGFLMNLIDIMFLKRTLTSIDFLRGFNYWFPFSYCILLVAIPYINKLMLRFDNKRIIYISGASFLALFAWGCLRPDIKLYRIVSMEHIIGPCWFCFVYIIVTFLHKNDFFKVEKMQSISRILFPISYSLMFILCKSTGKMIFRDMFSPLCFVSALSFFVVFHKSNIVFDRRIRYISGATLAMYLIQCHNNTKELLRYHVFKYDDYADSILFIPVCIGSVLILIFIAVITNSLRIKMCGLLRTMRHK